MSVFQRMPADPLMHILLDGRPLDWYGLSATDGVLAIEAPDLAVAYQNAPGMAGSHDVTLDDPLGCAYPGLRRIALGVVTVGEDDEMMDARRRLGALVGRSSTLSYRELPGQWRGRVTIKDWDERMLGPCRVDCATTIVMDAYPHIMGRAQRHALKEGANLLHVTGNRPAWPVLTLTTSRAVSALSDQGRARPHHRHQAGRHAASRHKRAGRLQGADDTGQRHPRPGQPRHRLLRPAAGHEHAHPVRRRRPMRARTRMDDLTCSTSSTDGATRNPPP